MKYSRAYPDPLESKEQENLITWAFLNEAVWPELSLLHHIPNGGRRDKREAMRLKAQGVKPGVSDLFLPVARCGYHGLYIEMKREHEGRVSEDQKRWIHNVHAQGYAAVVAHGWCQAAEYIKWYLSGNVKRISNLMGDGD